LTAEIRDGGNGAAPTAGTGRRRRRAIAGAGKVAGVGHSRTGVHHFPNRGYREKEENEANSFPSSGRPAKDSRSTLHGRRPWSTSEHTASTVERPVSREK